MAKEVAYVADFDSATGMLRALAASLRGESLPLLGAMRRSRVPLMKLVASAVNRLPTALQEQVYIWSGWMEATSSRKLAAVSGEEVAAWMLTSIRGDSIRPSWSDRPMVPPSICGPPSVSPGCPRRFWYP